MSWNTRALIVSGGCGLLALAGPGAREVARAEEAPAAIAGHCAAEGAGWSLLPGSDTCVQPGGYLWAEGYYNTYSDYPSDADKTYSIATLGLTLNTDTDTGRFGSLKGFVDIRFQYRTAEPWSGGDPETQVEPQDIYFTWGGLTVGYRDSLFDFYANANLQGTDPSTIGDDVNLTVISYARAFAPGWTGLVSVEDSHDRQGGIDPANAASSASFGQKSDMPDIVLAATRSADWGEAQLSAALHEIKAVTPAGFTGSSDPSAWGYALQAGVKLDLPDVAAGDSLYLQTAYADGATTYLGLIDASGDFAPPDAYVSASGSLSTVTGWNVTAQYLHNWTPDLNSAVFGGYASFDLDDATARASYGASGGENVNLGANLTWSPNAAVSLAAQYIYNRYAARTYTYTGYGLPESSQDAHQVLLMVMYTF